MCWISYRETDVENPGHQHEENKNDNENHNDGNSSSVEATVVIDIKLKCLVVGTQSVLEIAGVFALLCRIHMSQVQIKTECPIDFRLVECQPIFRRQFIKENVILLT